MAESAGATPSPAPSGRAPRTRWRLARVRITPGSIALILAAGAAAVILRNAFVSAHRQVGWAFASIVVAVLLMPLADLLDRYVPRWVALLASILALALVALVAWAAIFVNIRDSLDTLEGEAPKAAQRLEDKYEVARQFRLVERVNSLIENLRSGPGGANVGRAVGTAGTYFVCGILTLFFLVYGPKMLRSAFIQVRDRRRRHRAERIVLGMLKKGREYVFAALAQAVAVGVVVGMVVWLLDLPAPFILGLICGAVGTVPTLGIVVGGLPAILLAAGLEGTRDALILGAAVVALQFLEIQFVRKRVDRRTLHLGPGLPAIVALIGYQLYGYGGAVYGVIGLVFVIAWLDEVGYDDSPVEIDLPDADSTS